MTRAKYKMLHRITTYLGTNMHGCTCKNIPPTKHMCCVLANGPQSHHYTCWVQYETLMHQPTFVVSLRPPWPELVNFQLQRLKLSFDFIAIYTLRLYKLRRSSRHRKRRRRTTTPGESFAPKDQNESALRTKLIPQQRITQRIAILHPRWHHQPSSNPSPWAITRRTCLSSINFWKSS